MASSSSLLSWQALVLVANHLDPKTLAMASCVSKLWSSSMSYDILWEKVFTTHFPSLSSLPRAAANTLSYHRLYSIAAASANRRRKPPQKPKLSLDDLLFIITVDNSKSPPVTLTKPGLTLEDPNGLFRVGFDVGSDEEWSGFEVLEETRVTWNVVLRGFEGVFTMMDCNGNGGFVTGRDGWFTAELPAAGWCCAYGGGGMSGLVAELRVEMGGGGRRRVVERVSVGVLSVVSWRYVCVDDGLRYLQHFLQLL